MSEPVKINARYPVEMPDGHWIDKCGWEVWVKYGQYHRIDGPAVVFTDGTKWWYLNGKRHRTDGPAVVSADGTKQWWLNDNLMSFDEWLEENDELTDEQKVMFKLEMHNA